MIKCDELRALLSDSNWSSEIEFLNSLHWNITLAEHDGRYLILNGDQLLAEATSEEERYAYLLGLADALLWLPEPILSDIRNLAPDDAGSA